jgi:hypothetical protein
MPRARQIYACDLCGRCFQYLGPKTRIKAGISFAALASKYELKFCTKEIVTTSANTVKNRRTLKTPEGLRNNMFSGWACNGLMAVDALSCANGLHRRELSSVVVRFFKRDLGIA